MTSLYEKRVTNNLLLVTLSAVEAEMGRKRPRLLSPCTPRGQGDGSPCAAAADIASYIVSLSEERDREVKKLGITARELEVIRLSHEGLSNAEIAEKLFVSVFTVKNHKQNIYSKMNVRNNAAMLRVAGQLGII